MSPPSAPPNPGRPSPVPKPGRSKPDEPDDVGSNGGSSSEPLRWSAPANAVSTGTSPSIVAPDQPSRSTHSLATPSVPGMPVVSATVTCAARTTLVERRVRRRVDCRFGRRLAGLRIRGRDRSGDLPRDVEVDRTLRLQHAHELVEVEAERIREPGPDRNVTHALTVPISRGVPSPSRPIRSEIAQADLLVFLHRPEQAVLADPGLVADRLDRGFAIAAAAAVHHREHAVGPVVVGGPAVAMAHRRDVAICGPIASSCSSGTAHTPIALALNPALR